MDWTKIQSCFEYVLSEDGGKSYHPCLGQPTFKDGYWVDKEGYVLRGHTYKLYRRPDGIRGW